MDTVQDRDRKDLTEVKEMKRGGKNIWEKKRKKVLMTKITMMVWSLT